MEEENKKLLIILIICIVISVITLIGVIPGNGVKTSADRDAEVTKNVTDKALKSGFADDALSFAKAAETAYVDRQETNTVAFTLADLLNNYKTYYNKSGMEGCIIVTGDIDGNIKSKKIYITNKKYMINGLTADVVGKRLDQIVYKYNKSKDGWKESYNDCAFLSNDTSIKISTKTTEG